MTGLTKFVSLALALLLGAGMLWVFGQTASSAGLLPYQDAGSLTRGQVVYAENCASCHGDKLEGEPNWRERDSEGYLPAPPHDASGHTWHHPDEQLIAITMLGTEKIVGGNYRSRMIGFDEILSNDDILNALAYIKSTWPSEIIEQHNQINGDARN